MANEKLKQCPFCGSENINLRTATGETWVFCHGCGVSTDMKANTEQAITAWNTRNDVELLQFMDGSDIANIECTDDCRTCEFEAACPVVRNQPGSLDPHNDCDPCPTHKKPCDSRQVDCPNAITTTE